MGSAPKTVQDAYLEVLGKRKEDVNFKKQVICSKHWSCGKRLNLEDFPSVNLPSQEAKYLQKSSKSTGIVLLRSAPIPGALKQGLEALQTKRNRRL